MENDKILKHAPLIKIIAEDIQSSFPDLDLDDLISLGSNALAIAIKKFPGDPHQIDDFISSEMSMWPQYLLSKIKSNS